MLTLAEKKQAQDIPRPIASQRKCVHHTSPVMQESTILGLNQQTKGDAKDARRESSRSEVGCRRDEKSAAVRMKGLVLTGC